MKKFLLISFIFCSCAPVYLPNMRQVPMFTKQGEFQTSLATGNCGWQLQSAVAITDHIAFAVNYTNNTEKEYQTDRTTLDEHRFHRFLEGSAGYYDNIGIMFYEILGGYGQGKGYSFDEDWTTGNAEGKYDRYFIQPAFGLNKKKFQVAVAPRISMIDFKEFTNFTYSEPVALHTIFFLEPAAVCRLNTLNNHLYFTFQAAMAFPFAGNERRPPEFNYSFLQYYVGMGFRLGGLKEIKSKQKSSL